MNEVNLSDDATTYSEDATTTRVEATGFLFGKFCVVKFEEVIIMFEFDKFLCLFMMMMVLKMCVDFI